MIASTIFLFVLQMPRATAKCPGGEFPASRRPGRGGELYCPNDAAWMNDSCCKTCAKDVNCVEATRNGGACCNECKEGFGYNGPSVMCEKCGQGGLAKDVGGVPTCPAGYDSLDFSSQAPPCCNTCPDGVSWNNGGGGSEKQCGLDGQGCPRNFQCANLAGSHSCCQKCEHGWARDGEFCPEGYGKLVEKNFAGCCEKCPTGQVSPVGHHEMVYECPQGYSPGNGSTGCCLKCASSYSCDMDLDSHHKHVCPSGYTCDDSISGLDGVGCCKANAFQVV